MVPVWNPGPNLDPCVDSLLSQSMPAHDYEIVLVDDGSTDGTADRLDRLATQHPDRIRVIHSPPSGWPGRPRNTGIDAARGTYVQFVDNDDTLSPDALQRMCDTADRTGSDVVIGRPASNFRPINHTIYRRDRLGVTLAEFPDLVESMTPHKMFRKALLDRRGIRFPEGVPHEDQLFVTRALVHASAISLLTDRCYYFYLRRLGSGRNAGDTSVDSVAHFEALERLLDALDAEVPEEGLRDRLKRRFYRVEVLQTMWALGSLDGRPEEQRRLFETARRVATTRFDPAVRAGAGALHRTLGVLVENGDMPGTLEFAKKQRDIGMRAEARDLHWAADGLTLTIDATLTLAEEPMRCEPTPQGWALPAELAPQVPPEDRLLDPDRDGRDADVMLVSRVDSRKFGLGAPLRVITDDAGVVRVSGTIHLDPHTALAGAALSDGPWDLQLQVRVAGLVRTSMIRPATDVTLPAPLLTAGARMVRPFLDGTRRCLALDVGGWLRSPAAALAPSSELTVAGADRLRVSVAARSGDTTPIRVQFTGPDGGHGRPLGCVATLSKASPSTAAATLRLPPDLPDGEWQPWFQLESDGATPPVALPWLVRRAKREVHVHPRLAAGDGPPERGAQRPGDDAG